MTCLRQPSTPAVPNLFGTRDQFRGRQFSTDGGGGCGGGNGSGGNSSDGERWGALGNAGSNAERWGEMGSNGEQCGVMGRDGERWGAMRSDGERQMKLHLLARCSSPAVRPRS